MAEMMPMTRAAFEPPVAATVAMWSIPSRYPRCGPTVGRPGGPCEPYVKSLLPPPAETWDEGLGLWPIHARDPAHKARIPADRVLGPTYDTSSA
ncbi:hypothetical protein Cpa01nite_06930 [Cellulomonas pakistanensis]|uniref:Uncharacterized protein n=1 Tax=Cellulomonas pakistanensis TaxID=992287 RepID=A0A919PBQ0_9CELL|nr:hypothetical protein Cpa01nite_06930 [Cellulomonas pakistanensis]